MRGNGGVESAADVAAVVSLVQWARAKGCIRKLWVFCSRWKGANRQDSDLDVCIEIEMPPKSWRRTTSVTWEEELTSLFGVRSHIERNTTNDSKVRIAESGALIYSRD
jgi:predicted nucleotidyltransferase